MLDRERIHRWFGPGARELVARERDRPLFRKLPDLEW